MDVVYHLPKVLTESDDHAVRIIWMAYTVGKLKVIKSSLSLPDGVEKKSHCLLLEKCQRVDQKCSFWV